MIMSFPAPEIFKSRLPAREASTDMPIKLPELDNRTFDDLMKEMIASIPRYSKEWTNFNPSDPGITVLELLSWISESLIYRADRIPEKSYINFLKLVAGTKQFDANDMDHNEIRDYLGEITRGSKKADVQSIKAAAQKFLRSKYRAVTEEDFRELALEASPEVVKRVEVFSSTSLVSVVIIVDPAKQGDPDLIDASLARVRSYLDGRRLLGTIVNVRQADYTDLSLRIELTCEPYAKSDSFGKTVAYAPGENVNPSNVEGAVAAAIVSYLDSIKGGAEGKGWPYSRALMVYELFNIVEKIDAIKYVNRITQLLFSMESSFTNEFPKDDQPMPAGSNVQTRFEMLGFPLPEDAKIVRTADGWKISDKDGKNDLYFIHASVDGLNVYRSFTDIKVNGLISLMGLEVKIEEIGNE
jgi:hypothetical protein